MKKVTLYTDGACSGNPGIGGWAYVLKFGVHEKEVSGYSKDSEGKPAITTNNVMELLAVILGLQALKEQCEVEVVTDSAYVANAFNEGWINKWQANGWRGDRRRPVKNEDLWKVLLVEYGRHKVTFTHIKGHADNEFNNRCDKAAVEATKEAKRELAKLGLVVEKQAGTGIPVIVSNKL